MKRIRADHRHSDGGPRRRPRHRGPKRLGLAESIGLPEQVGNGPHVLQPTGTSTGKARSSKVSGPMGARARHVTTPATAGACQPEPWKSGFG